MAIDIGKFNILGVSVNAIDYDATVKRIIQAAQKNNRFSVTALAVHGLMIGFFDLNFRYQLQQIDIVTPDGMPVRWTLNLLYKTRLKKRVYGPRLMLIVLEHAAQLNLPIYLYGSKPGVLEALKKNLLEWYPQLQIAGSQPSKFRPETIDEQQETVQHIRDSGAKILFVGLGCPLQEKWLYEHLSLLPMPMIAVGAAYDFHSGFSRQAPDWMQMHGLEWLFRLSQEPRRLWRRYLIYNPIYLVLVMLQFLHIYTPDPNKATLPDEPEMIA